MPTFKIYNGRLRSKYHYFCENCNEFAEVEVHNFSKRKYKIQIWKNQSWGRGKRIGLVDKMS